jgi:hypothetical protein
MIPVKGQEPGAFVLTHKKDGKKDVMSEATLSQLLGAKGEEVLDKLFTVERVVLNDEERKLAEEIRHKLHG